MKIYNDFMKNMMKYLNNIDYYIDNGYIKKRKHPEYDIWILNYTSKTQIEGKWDELTLKCRGLIIDDSNNIICQPISKFFNLDELIKYKNYLSTWYGCELDDLIKMKFTTTEKLDGSLLIVFWYRDKWITSTRGSFESEQAIHGKNLIENKYKDIFTQVPKDDLFLYEIIYKDNRIVVDYGDFDDIVLLAVINTKTGEEYDILEYCRQYNLSFLLPKVFAFDQLAELSKLEERDNFEGVVIKFDNGVRVKWKREAYKILHRIMTGITPKRIFEAVSSGISIEEWLKDTPDEFYEEVKSQARVFEAQFSFLKECAIHRFNDIKHLAGNRKEFALEAKKFANSTLQFSLLDNKDIDQQIWNIIKNDIKEEKHEKEAV